MKATTRLNVVLPASVMEHLRQRAQQESRSVSNLAASLLRQALKQTGAHG